MTSSENLHSIYTMDLVIIGGGIAGLWLLNHLSALGYSCVLLEADQLGAGQSIASQGIIHGGLKYALRGEITNAAESISAMPQRWRDSLDGNDPVDLSGCELLSENYFMWSEGSLRSRLKAFLGSKSLSGRVDRVADGDFPQTMTDAKGLGALYQLPDFVIDTRALIHTLSARLHDRVFKVLPANTEFSRWDDGQPRELLINHGEASISLRAKRFLLTAGEGNQTLMQRFQIDGPQMQTRPLNMVVVRKPGLPELFVHCVGDDFSLTPRLTITSHACENGETAWYLGGELAEDGVQKSDEEQFARAQTLLAEQFPWVDLDGAKWGCLRINRAEGREEGRHRPDQAFLRSDNEFMIAWPTKFTLSPALADAVAQELVNQRIDPSISSGLDALADLLPGPEIAQPPWETLFAND